MTISYSQLPAFTGMLQDASRDEKLWLAFDSRIQLPSINDLQLFDTRAQADDFVHFNQQQQKAVTLLPLEATRYFLHESAKSLLQDGVPSPHIELDESAIFSIHEEMRFQQIAGTLEEMMEGFDWTKTFYDPLEANTEAETVEDKIAFNRLEFLVEQLSSFAQTGERGKAAVNDLVQRYWSGEAMEAQIETVLNGDHRLKNEANYKHYGIDPDANPLLSKDGNAFTDALIDHWEQQQSFNNKSNVMNTNNEAFLKDNLKYTGFGESLYPELERNIKEGKAEFQLHFKTQIGNRPFEAVLDFKKGKGDMYFFNGYTATLERANGDKLSQYIKVKKGRGIAGKEAFNMLQGRAIVDRQKMQDLSKEQKETLEVKPWVELDFSKPTAKGFELHPYSEGYGYHLKDAVNKFPVHEMDGAEKEKELLRSLEKGNAQQVTMTVNGKDEKFFMEANPSRKSINVYDSHFVMQKHEHLPKREQPVEQAMAKENVQVNGKEQKQDRSRGQRNGQATGKGSLTRKGKDSAKGIEIS